MALVSDNSSHKQQLNTMCSRLAILLKRDCENCCEKCSNPEKSTKDTSMKLRENMEQKSKEKSCNNCCELIDRLSECKICTNPLQNSEVRACCRCGGLWCGGCALRLISCPWCRAPSPKGPNLPLVRLLYQLRLPCRNKRLGCETRVTADKRQDHESKCDFNIIICPIKGHCKHVSPLNTLVDHINTSHQITTIISSKVNILLENVNSKIMKTAMCISKHKVCLLAYDSAFLIKVSLFNFNLNITMSRVDLKKEEKIETTDDKTSQYCAYVEYSSGNDTNKSVIIIDRENSRKCLLHRSEYSFKSWSGGNANIFITIHTVPGQGQPLLTL